MAKSEPACRATVEQAYLSIPHANAMGQDHGTDKRRDRVRAVRRGVESTG